MSDVIEISDLSKTYTGGFHALRNVSLNVRKGEILALLGPNGAGKTTLISIVCGLVIPSSGSVRVGGYDVTREFRKSRSLIGLVPQELPTDIYENVWNMLRFSRGLFGRKADPEHLESVLRSLSLWDRRNSRMFELSGGMKRRVLIAKALAHEPEVLFLDEPTAGVDVELRQDMWRLIQRLQDQGVTIILTTHYIEEAEQMADRIGIIDHGQIVLVQEKDRLMAELGRKQLVLNLQEPLADIPVALSSYTLELAANGCELVYTYDSHASRTGIAALLRDLGEAGIRFSDVRTMQSSLEDIFVDLIRGQER